MLRALLQERNVTRAAEAVGLTQPAVSNALARLRRRFGDELLIRVGREHELTPLGQTLLDRVETAYDSVERLFEDDFEPSASTRVLSIFMSDYSVVLLSGPIKEILKGEAPGVRLDLQQLTASVDFHDALRQSDGVIAPPDIIAGYPRMKLIADRWVCVVAKDNPLIASTLTTDDLAKLPWVGSYSQTIISSSPPLRQMRALGIQPHIEVSVESFLAVPFLVAGTDRVGFIPAKLASRFSQLTDIEFMPSPLPVTDHLVALHWDAAHTNDPGHRWFRDVLQRAARTVAS